MKVIFVCTGNTCRSPMAEGYLKKLMPNITVESRGLFANGDPVSEYSLKAAAKKGLDISGHISKPFTPDDIDADSIICMSKSHRDILVSAGIVNDKISVLGNGIPDPFGGTLEDYSLCRDKIFDAIDVLYFKGFFDNIKILPLSADAISNIAHLEAECFSEPWSENAIAESFAAGTIFFTAYINDIFTGYIGISAICGEGYITNIAVLNEYRNLGIATKLLSRVIKLASEKKLEFISLEVRESNSAAISLYTKLDFSPEGVRKAFYRAPTENAIIMTRRFNFNEDT